MTAGSLPHPEPSRWQTWRSMTAAFLRMDVIEDFSYPMVLFLSEVAFVLPVLINYFVGELVNDPRVGNDYFTFAAIGVAVTGILQASLSGFGISLQRAQGRGQFETLLVEPVQWVYLPFAMNLWRAGLGFINGLLILTVAGLLGAAYNFEGVPPFLVLVLLGMLASMAVGIMAASVMVVAKRSQPILTLYGLASSLLAGAVFSVDQLPGLLRPLSWIIPQTYVINGARYVLMDDPGTFIMPFGDAVLALVVFNAVMLSFGLWLFMRAVRFARETGILGGY
jgi:ABC-2 type transport system permease protein